MRPEPHPGPGEVRIRVKAAGVSPVDLALRAGTSPSAGGLALPHFPGVDAAGIVDEVGAAVTGVGMGDEVFGAVDVSRLGGATAEFAVLAFWARKAVAMSWEEAGGGGTGIETATRALELLGVGPGVGLLIDGARRSGNSGGSARCRSGCARHRDRKRGRLRFIATVGAGSVAHGPGLARRVRASGFGPIDLALDVAARVRCPS
ncbi:MAG: alcohol dehydrogenase catalytic domain-containing protein [Galbitalea sp.]